jgi:hypothetical protein
MTELTTATEVVYSDDDYVPIREGGSAGLKKGILSNLAAYFQTKMFGALTGQAGKYATVKLDESGFQLSPAPGALPSALYEDQKAANTAGGTATSGSWLTRVLNTEVFDDIGIGLAANQLTLPAGIYRIECFAPFVASDRSRMKLRDITNGVDLLFSNSQNGSSGNGAAIMSHMAGLITLGASTVVELQYRVQTTRATNGLGVESNFGVTEIYSRILLTKLS